MSVAGSENPIITILVALLNALTASFHTLFSAPFVPFFHVGGRIMFCLSATISECELQILTSFFLSLGCVQLTEPWILNRLTVSFVSNAE